MHEITNSFSSYQHTICVISKFHALIHLADNLKSMGSLEYLQESHFESSHKPFKRSVRTNVEKNLGCNEEAL